MVCCLRESAWSRNALASDRQVCSHRIRVSLQGNTGTMGGPLAQLRGIKTDFLETVTPEQNPKDKLVIRVIRKSLGGGRCQGTVGTFGRKRSKVWGSQLNRQGWGSAVS